MEMMLDAGAWKGRWFNGKWEVAEQTASVTDKATGEEIAAAYDPDREFVVPRNFWPASRPRPD